MNRFSSPLVTSLVFAFVLLVPITAQATLSTASAPLTWNIIGLDSNDPLNGPNKFPVGTRVCSDVATTNVSVSFIWDTANPLINLRTGSLSTVILPSISAGGCADAYFEAEVTQVPAAFDTTRRYHITATDFSGTVSTPTPRELYVEHLISQSRNSISTVEYGPNLLSLTTVPAGGGMSLVVGNTYVVRLTGGTATQGYNQFEEFINFSNAVFQILGVDTTYSADNSPYVPNPNDKLYADACQWENDPNSPNYRSCVGGDFKAGGSTVVTTYTIKIIGGGGTSQTLSTLLYDFSGSSFHYNADFSTGARIGNIIDPTSANISKSFSPNPAPVNGVSALTITLTNPNGASLGGYNFVDNLPANLIVATPPAATTSGCGTPTLTAVAGSSTISFSNGTLAANSNCIIKVNVTPTATGLLTNTTNNLFIGTVDTGHSATAPLTVNNDPPPGTGLCGLTFARWTFPTGFSTTAPVPSTLNVASGAGFAGPGVVPVSSTNSTTTADGTLSWGSNGGIASALATTNDDYFQFAFDTTGITSVTLSFDALHKNPNGPRGLAIYYGTATKPATTAEPGAAIYNQANALTLGQNNWQAFPSIVTVNSGLNPSGLTYFRIYSFNSNNTTSGFDINIDNVAFTGCTAGTKPTISKNFSPDPIAVNGVSTLTFTLTNPNATALTGANFTDSLPAGVQVAATPAASTTCTGSPTWAPLAGATTLTFGTPTGGTIPASGSCTVSVNVTATTGGAHSNVSGFLVTTETGTSTGSVATDTLTAVLPPSITKQFAPSPILPGGTSTLTFTITNPNQDNAISGVAFSDTFPVAPGAMTVASPANASTSGCGAPTFAPAPGAGSVSFTGGTIAGGGTCIVTVNVTAPVVGTYGNTTGNVSHIINAQTVNGNTASDTLEVEPPTPSISLLKQVGLSPAGPWSTFEAVTTGPVYYRFTIENTGDVPLNPVTLTDNTVDVSACNAALVGVTLPVAVPANDNHIFQCVAGPFAITPGSHTNTAHATGTFSGTPYNSEDSLATYATAALTIDKSVVQPTFLNAGDVLNYNYLVTNSGFATLSAPVTVTDDKTTVTCPAVSTVGDFDNFFDPGESMTCTATYIITAGDVTNAFVTNTAFATADGVSSPTDSTTSVLATAADLSLDKSVNNPTPSFGQNIVFTITVSNAGPATANGVAARDLLPAGLSYVSDNGAGAYVSGTGVWTIGSIVSGGSASLQITATVNATGTISNYAQVTAAGQPDPDSTPNDNSTNQDDDDTQDIIVPPSADLSLDKSVNNPTPAYGQNVVFTIAISNAGPDTATGVTVRDLLPAELIYVSDNGGGSYVSGTGVWTIGSIVSGGSASLQITATVNATGTISNYAQVTASGVPDPDSTPNDDSINQDDDDSQDLTVPPTADLSLDKSVDDDTPAFGQNVTFTVTVSNAGPDTATGVVARDLLPAGLSYVSDNGGGAYVSGTGVWTIGSIANGASASLQITATVNATGTISNYAQVTASGQADLDSTPNDNSTTEDDDDTQDLIVPSTADLSLDKSVDDDTPAFGQTIVFTITVSNGGPDTATGVVVEDLLPAGLSYVSDNGGGAYVSGTGIWTIGSIVNGGSASLQITATVTGTGSISNYAQVSASGSIDPDSTPNDDSINQDDDDTQGLTVPPTADLSLDKSVNNPTPAFGGTVVFTITVSNAGPDTATGVVVEDLLPAGLSYVSDNGGGAYVSGTGIWTIGSIVSGGSASLQITATVTATGSISNYAQITESGQTDPDSTPNDDSINQDDDDTQGLTVPSTADLSLDKSVDNATPAFGGTVVFTVTVSNAGPDTATGVVARDLLPAGLTYVSDNGGGAYVSGTGVWTIGSIANGASASLQITATVAATGTISNYAQVTASNQTDPDSTPNDNSTNQDDDDTQDLIVPSTADLSLDKSVNNPTPAFGGTVVFTITVSNGGPDTATGVVVEDLLPAGLSYVSDNGGGAYVSGTGIWTIGSIVNGGSASLQITATVTSTGSISNYAQITASGSTDPDSTPNDDSINQDDDDSQDLIVPSTADLSLDKSVDDSTPALNQNIVFTITVSNAGPDTATGVVVSDLLPAGLSYVSDNGGGAYVSGTGIWTIGSIANGASASLQITAQVTTTSNITNTAQVTASDQTDPDSTPGNGAPAEDDQDSTLIGATAADLSLDKSVNNPTPALNSNVTFTITVTNGGPDTATGVVVEDLLPAGLTYVSDNGGGAYVSGTGIWTIGSIVNGGSASLQITAQVTATGTIANYAQVSASDQVDPDSSPNDDSINQDDDDTESVSATAADLSLDKSVDDATPAFGQNVVFTITISNAGPSTATGVAVRDLLPAGLTYVSDNGGGAYVSGTGIWTIGSIANGASASLQITATVAATGTITNSAQVSAANEVDPDSTPNDNSTTQDDDDTQGLVVPATADLALDKSVDDPTPAFGQNIVFTITVSNAGPDTATGITVEDLLGAGLTYVSDNGGGAYNSGTGIWTVGTLVNGASASLQITATVTATGQLSNYAQIVTSTGTDPDSDPNDDSVDEDDDDTVDIPVPPTADLSLIKIVDDITPSLGQNVVFTITVSNAGPDTATGVVVTDQLPAGVSYVSDNGGSAYVSGTGVWTVGTLANGASASLQITAQVTTTANVTNTAQITAANQFDPDSTPNNNAPAEDDQDNASIGATAADLSLTKNVNNPTPKLNSNVTFTLTVSNAGPDTATNVVVSDLLSGGLVYVSDNGGGAYVPVTGMWTVGTLANGASASLQITATVTTSSINPNNAQVETSDQIDPDSTPGSGGPAEDDYDTATVDATAADLSLVKTVDNTAPQLNGNVTYTLTLTNAGPDTATNVTVFDQLPAGLTFVSSNASAGSFNNGTHIWTIPSLGVGQSATLQIVATVTSTNPIVNTAQVMASDQGDPDSVPANSNGSEDDQDDAPVVVAAAAGVAIPTASELGLMLMALMLAVAGAMVMKAR